MTTAYWVSSVVPGTVRGSMRTPLPAKSGTFCVVTSTPSLKRYQLSEALVAVAHCRMMGGGQPAAPPSGRGTFGRKYFAAALVAAADPLAVAPLSTPPPPAPPPPAPPRSSRGPP